MRQLVPNFEYFFHFLNGYGKKLLRLVAVSKEFWATDSSPGLDRINSDIELSMLLFPFGRSAFAVCRPERVAGL